MNALIVERFNALQDEKVNMTNEQLTKSDADLAAEIQKDKTSSKRSKNKPAKIQKKKRKVSENGNGINTRKVNLSEPLRDFLGEAELARTQVVKKVWDYIKENELQNPEDRREILCDDRMKPIFGDKMTMFSLNKILSKHLFNPEKMTSSNINEKNNESEHNKDTEESSIPPDSVSDAVSGE